MSRISFYVLTSAAAIIVLLGGCSSQVTPTQVPIQYEISGTKWEENSDGNLYFDVVVKNAGEAAWDNVVLGIDLIDERGEIIEECVGSTFGFSSVPSGEYVYLRVECKLTESFYDYSIDVLASVSDKTASDEERCITDTIYARDLVVVEIGRVRLENYAEIHGVVVNASKLPATGLMVGNVAVFDKNKNLVDIGLCTAELKNLEWKEQMPIECDVIFLPEDAELIWMIDGSFRCELTSTATP